METNNKKSSYTTALFCFIAFVVGYLLYPQINHTQALMGGNQSDNLRSDDTHMMQGGRMSMRQMMDSMAVGLQDKTGTEFDAAFLEEMIPHHLGAITMARMALVTSKRPEIIKLANDIIAAQEKEIETMRGWQRQWFGVQAQ